MRVKQPLELDVHIGLEFLVEQHLNCGDDVECLEQLVDRPAGDELVELQLQLHL